MPWQPCKNIGPKCQSWCSLVLTKMGVKMTSSFIQTVQKIKLTSKHSLFSMVHSCGTVHCSGCGLFRLMLILDKPSELPVSDPCSEDIFTTRECVCVRARACVCVCIAVIGRMETTIINWHFHTFFRCLDQTRKREVFFSLFLHSRKYLPHFDIRKEKVVSVLSN